MRYHQQNAENCVPKLHPFGHRTKCSSNNTDSIWMKRKVNLRIQQFSNRSAPLQQICIAHDVRILISAWNTKQRVYVYSCVGLKSIPSQIQSIWFCLVTVFSTTKVGAISDSAVQSFQRCTPAWRGWQIRSVKPSKPGTDWTSFPW